MLNVDQRTRDDVHADPPQNRRKAWASAAAVTVLISGVGAWAVLRPQDPGDIGLTLTQTAACSDQVFTGSVISVDDALEGIDDGYTTVTFDVNEWLQPGSGAAATAVSFPTDSGSSVRLTRWDGPLLVLVPTNASTKVETIRTDVASRATELRRTIEADDLPACPS